ncbi:MAG: flagellar basal-body MS-ring/collar protein FliF [Tumebacillaceae bacterium]
MNQQIKQLIEKLSGYWKNLDGKQRRNLMFVGIFFVLTVALLSWFALRPNYVVLLANQTPASLGEVSTKLDELKVPYQVSSDSISVPEANVNDARMKLAMAGLPQSGASGYGVFDNSSFGMTENEFNVRYKQAIEGEIKNSIQTLKGVQEARVNVVPEEKKTFVTDQENNAKASIVLLLEPGVKLTDDQIIGIQNLVSHSVRGLSSANVSIVDQNGTRLVDEQGQALAGGLGNGQISKQQQIQNQVENDVRNRIRNSLERLVGLGNVDVIVHAKLNFEQKKWTEQTLSPPIKGSDTGAVISERNTSEETEGTQGANGVPGQQTNATGTPPTYQQGATGTSSSTKKDNTANYEWNKRVENGESAPYTVDQYTVSVLLDYPNFDQTVETQIKQFVSTAIGQFNDGSADPQITVANAKFQTPSNPFDTTAFYKQPWFLGVAAAALVLLGGGVYALSRRRKVAEVPVQEPPRITEVQTVVEESESQKMRKQLEKLASQKPEEFVNLLRTWLVEE